MSQISLNLPVSRLVSLFLYLHPLSIFLFPLSFTLSASLTPTALWVHIIYGTAILAPAISHVQTTMDQGG